MIPFNELKPGDKVMAEFEGQHREGIVKDLNREDKEVCIETDVQEFWFKPEHIFPIPISDEQLAKLGFVKQANADGSAKYSKEAFRIVVPDTGDFYPLEIWYREDHRLLAKPIALHELQNHYYSMTKVELNAV
jgi:hypothetical protein